jgi:hypothetical protein
MAGFYHYPYYILRSNAVCNEGCYHPKGYKVHWDSSNWVSCIKKLTFSIYNVYRKHSGKYQLKKFYQQRKLTKIQASDEKDLEIDLFENNP